MNINLKSVTATVMRNNLADVLDAVDDERSVMLVKRRNQADAALINVDLLEDLLAGHNAEYLARIKQAREDIKRGELFTADDVFGEL